MRAGHYGPSLLPSEALCCCLRFGPCAKDTQFFYDKWMRRRREGRENRQLWRSCNRIRNLKATHRGEGEAVGLNPEVRIPADVQQH